MSRKILAIAALLALPAAVVAVALAQTVVQDGAKMSNRTQADGTVSTHPIQPVLVGGMLRQDSTMKALTLDADGNIGAAVSNPEQTFLVRHSNLIQGSLWRVGQCQAAPTTCTQVLPQVDSTQAKSMLGANKVALLIHYTLDADSGYASLLAVQVRGHYSPAVDSTNTFYYRHWATAAADTIGSFADRIATVVDTTGAIMGERLVLLNRTDGNRKIWINLVNPATGEWFNAPYISVRFRIVKAYGTTAGTAFTGKLGPLTSIQAELIGWR